MKIGEIYLMLDPDFNSEAFFSLHRLAMPRVPVTLLRRRPWSIRNHYEVEYQGRRYRTGRLERVKAPCSSKSSVPL
jgi:hypothetical protein